MTTTPKALPETREYKMHPDRCRVACSRESCTCAPNRFDWEARPLVDRLSDEADQCRNDGANDIAALLDEAVQALNASTPADSLASAGGVEAPDFLTDTDVARIRRRVYGGPRFDTLERQWAAEIEHAVRERFIAALSKEREVADGLRAELDAAYEALARIGDYAHDKSTGPAVPDALWEVRSMAYSAVGPAISALTAHRESRGENT